MVLTGSPTSTERTSRHQRLRRLAAAVALPATLAGAALLSAPAALADVPAGPGSLTVHYSDGAVDWTVPTGVYQVSVTAVGGSGGNGSDAEYDVINGSASRNGSHTGGTPGAGGSGALVRATVPVVPGQQLHLEPGSAGAAPDAGKSTGPFAPGGTGSIGEHLNGVGGGGGAATVIRTDTTVLAAAGGGGGGGGTGEQLPPWLGGSANSPIGWDGGAGGDAGSAGSHAPDTYGQTGGPGGVGLAPGGSAPPGAGENGHRLGLAATGRWGGAGAGGGGLDAQLHGGGAGGTSTEDAAGSGGGAGGPSFAVDPDARFGTASNAGDGWVTISWTPGVPLLQTLSGPDSVEQGHPVTLTDTLPTPRADLPAPTGSVTFEQRDAATQSWQPLGSADVAGGQSSLSASLAGLGLHAFRAVYSGDSTYFPTTSEIVFTTVVATTTSLSVSPSPVTFGNVATGRVATRTVTVTNTGALDWALDVVSSDDPAVRFSSESCDALAPGASCTATVAFGPTATGPVSATLTVEGDTATASVTVTGTGVLTRPVVTHVSPAFGSRKGGTLVTITGRNFTGVTAIRIGSAAMTSVTCSSSTTCTAITPRGTVGVKDIRVITAGGTSARVRADVFSYR